MPTMTAYCVCTQTFGLAYLTPRHSTNPKSHIACKCSVQYLTDKATNRPKNPPMATVAALQMHVCARMYLPKLR